MKVGLTGAVSVGQPVRVMVSFTAAVSSAVASTPAPTTQTFNVAVGQGSLFPVGCTLLFGANPKDPDYSGQLESVGGDSLTLVTALATAPATGEPVWAFVPTDPTTVTFTWDQPAPNSPVVAMTTTTYASGASSGGPPTIVRLEQGWYYADVVPTSGGGPLRWRMTGGGACQAAVQDQFDVDFAVPG
jgi:hypothetical protein